ncbi:MAG: tRNA (pseudouridine(54)-N(1))-methyltransferase TrmY, partial [Candidatus Methanomethylicia archaeon]
MRRIFLVKSSTAITSPKISLRNIAGSSGRMDVICRSILNAFFIDVNEFRRNVTFYGVLEGPPDPPKTLCIDGFMVEGMILDEVWILEVIMDLMRGKIVKGFNIIKRGFQDVVRSLINDGFKLLYMHEDGV